MSVTTNFDTLYKKSYDYMMEHPIVKQLKKENKKLKKEIAHLKLMLEITHENMRLLKECKSCSQESSKKKLKPLYTSGLRPPNSEGGMREDEDTDASQLLEEERDSGDIEIKVEKTTNNALTHAYGCEVGGNIKYEIIESDPIVNVNIIENEVVIIPNDDEPVEVVVIEEEEEVEVEAEEEVEVEAEEEVEVEAEEEAEEEVFEIFINNKQYYTTNSDCGIIYDVDEAGEINMEVGKFENGIVKFY